MLSRQASSRKCPARSLRIVLTRGDPANCSAKRSSAGRRHRHCRDLQYIEGVPPIRRSLGWVSQRTLPGRQLWMRASACLAQPEAEGKAHLDQVKGAEGGQVQQADQAGALRDEDQSPLWMVHCLRLWHDSMADPVLAAASPCVRALCLMAGLEGSIRTCTEVAMKQHLLAWSETLAARLCLPYVSDSAAWTLAELMSPTQTSERTCGEAGQEARALVLEVQQGGRPCGIAGHALLSVCGAGIQGCDCSIAWYSCLLQQSAGEQAARGG